MYYTVTMLKDRSGHMVSNTTDQIQEAQRWTEFHAEVINKMALL